jgi:hypothetical protein
MASFMLIARDGPQDFADVSPEDMQRIIEKYVAWGTKLEEAGKKRAGSKLRDGEGRVLRGDSGKLTVTDGPFSETKETVPRSKSVKWSRGSGRACPDRTWKSPAWWTICSGASRDRWSPS